MSQVQTIGKNNSGGVSFFSIATVIMMLLYFMPQAMVFVRNDMMAIIVTAYYFLFVSKYVSPVNVIKALLIGLPYLVLFWLVGSQMNFRLGFILPFMTLWTLIMPLFAVIAIIKRNNPVEQRFILVSTGICLLYVAIMTFRALDVDPLIMREMAGSDDNAVLVARMQGVGGFGIAYSIGALFISLWVIHKYIKHLTYLKFFNISIIIACGIMVVKSQYATLLFLTVFGIALYYIIEARTFTQRMTVVVVALITVYAAQTLIVWASQMIGGEVLQFKFQLIYNSLWGGEGAENISGDRSQLQIGAFDLFLRSPLYGEPGVVNTEAYSESHSTLLSVMASSGIIGLISYLGVFYYSGKRMFLSVFDSVSKKLYVPVATFYFALAWLNPIDFSFECSWMIFFVIPLIYVVSYNPNKI